MTRTIYVCQACSAQYSKWLGQCKECQSWSTIVEEISNQSNPYANKSYKASSKDIAIEKLNSYDIREVQRYTSGITEFDRVLGGGFVIGSVILCTGEPGIGKSTLLLQIINRVQQIFTQDSLDKKSLYVTGEESISQIKIRAQRLHIDNSDIMLISTTRLEDIISTIKSNMSSGGLVVIDSIQTMYTDIISAPPGSVSQVRACTFEIIRVTKEMNITTIMVGHVTKDGQIAGPKVLEHMVDAALSFEGDPSRQYRILRTSKNRYGSTNEIGIFEMTDLGLSEVDNPSAIFISNHVQNVVGSCIFAGIEGTRGLLVEVQALVVHSYLPLPKRAAIGWDANRLSMLIAILISKLNMRFGDKDIYLNIVGGIRIAEPAIDLAVAVSLISATTNIAVPCDCVFFGEIGLLGELRAVTNIDVRIAEANKLGFKRAIVPKIHSKKKRSVKDREIELIEIEGLYDLFEMLFGKSY